MATNTIVQIQMDPEELGRLIKESSKQALAEHDAHKEQLETLLQSHEAAKLLGVSKQTLWHWRKTGLLKFRRMGSKLYYPKTDLLAALDAAPHGKGRRGAKAGLEKGGTQC